MCSSPESCEDVFCLSSFYISGNRGTAPSGRRNKPGAFCSVPTGTQAQVCPPGLQSRELGSAASCGLSRPPVYPLWAAGPFLAAGGSGGRPKEAVFCCRSPESPRKAGGAERVPGRDWSRGTVSAPWPGLRVLTTPSGDRRRPSGSRPGDSPCTSSPGSGPVSWSLVPAYALCGASWLRAVDFTVSSGRGRRPGGGRWAQPRSEPPVLLVSVSAIPSARFAVGAQETPPAALPVIGVLGHRRHPLQPSRPAQLFLRLLHVTKCVSRARRSPEEPLFRFSVDFRLDQWRPPP